MEPEEKREKSLSSEPDKKPDAESKGKAISDTSRTRLMVYPAQQPIPSIVMSFVIDFF